MVISMPLMSSMATEHGHGAVTDPFMRWAMSSLDPVLRSGLFWLM